MNVFIATLAHETNSFSPIPTSLRNYHDGVFFRPSEHTDDEAETCFVGYGDFVRVARKRGHETVLSLAAWAQPSAPTVQADYEAIRDEILADLKNAFPVDAVLVLLHGAQMARGYDDCEGDLLQRIREIVGPDTPVGVELDLHCNVTKEMVDSATIINCCKEYPHIDFPDRAEELYDLIERTVHGELKPVMAYCPAPMLAKFHTTRQPMRGLVDQTIEMEGRDGVLSISLAHGFAWADISEAGAGALVVCDGDTEKAETLAEHFARELFALRSDVRDKFCPMDGVLDEVLSLQNGLTVIADSSDNAGGGAPGDSTYILRALLERGATDVALGMIWDPVAVEFAMAAGEGAELSLRIGGKAGVSSGQPVDAVAKVLRLHKSPVQRGLEPDRPERVGPAAAIRIAGIDVIINSIRQQVFSPDCFTALGVDLTQKRIVVVKSSQHFYAQFEQLADDIIYCDAPGALNSDLEKNPYTKIRRPIWPLDEVEWRKGADPT